MLNDCLGKMSSSAKPSSSNSSPSPAPSSSPQDSLVARFVFWFNAAAATLWWCCLGRWALLLPLVGRRFLPGGIAEFFQVLALFPALSHLLRWFLLGYRSYADENQLWSLVFAAKAIYICYGVIFPSPLIAKHSSYSVLIVSWGLQILSLYSYKALRSVGLADRPWIRSAYLNLAFFTFPASTVAEMILIFLSLAFTDDDSWAELFNKAVLVAYIPVSYFAWQNLKKRRTRLTARWRRMANLAAH